MTPLVYKYLQKTLLTLLSLNVILIAGLFLESRDFKGSVRATALTNAVRLRKPVHDDSWRPMLTAYQLKREQPGADMYQVFFKDHIKFQYPPTSLIFFDFLPSSVTTLANGTFSAEFQTALSWLSRLAVILTVVVSALILGVQGVEFILCVILGAMFYPLIIGYELGQIQVFLNLLGALAVWAMVKKKELLAGVLIGICCLVKPQCGVFLIWALARKRWSFAGSMAAVCLLGLTISIAHFGLQDHLRYLDVLKMISRQGETFWPNQSMNGLMNRFLQYGDHKFFSPYNPMVYGVTLVSSIALLMVALWNPGRSRLRSQADGLAVDFGLMLLAATMASPVAWGHHYGVFFPVFALALPLLMRERPMGEATMPLLLLSYVAVSQILVRPDLIHINRWIGLTGSHVYLGGLIFYALLVRLRIKLVSKTGEIHR